ncbi:MAG: phage terminase large subunit family protein [Thermoguttaceae bacterium]
MGAPFEGAYSFTRHPWCRDIHDSQAIWTVAMKAAQLGVTETGINRAFYTLDRLRRDVLYVLPTTINASDFSKARFATALKLSPYLSSLFVDTNTVGLKSTGTNVLYIRGSRGDSNLKSIPVSELVLDELDEMDTHAVWLALERLSGQIEKHILAISTPTVPKYGIHKLYLTGTQEHFFFQCPHCGRWTELVWPDCIEIIGESVNDPRCKESFIKCKECKHSLDHRAKPIFLADGVWRPTELQVSAEECRSFYINQLYSSTVTPGELAIAYHRGLGDEAANTEFHNSKLGNPFVGEGAQVTDEMIDNCLRGHTINEARPTTGGDRLITMGADQGKTGYISIVDWTFDQEPGLDINAAAIGKLLWFGKFPEDGWDYLAELMYEWQVLASVVDADPNINDARRFARRFPGSVWLTRYRRGQTAKEASIQEEETGAPFAIVDRTNWLSCTLGRFKTNPARILLPRDISLEYREHIKNLVRTYEKDDTGNMVATYVNTGADHYAHSLCYADIGLSLVTTGGSGGDVGKVI